MYVDTPDYLEVKCIYPNLPTTMRACLQTAMSDAYMLCIIFLCKAGLVGAMWLDHYDSCERMRPSFKYVVVGTLKKVLLILGNTHMIMEEGWNGCLASAASLQRQGLANCDGTLCCQISDAEQLTAYRTG